MIYVHVPFCRSFCTYCDFYSEIASRCGQDGQKKFDLFSEALSREAALRSGEITDDVNTMYIGGGTPSVLPLYVFSNLLGTLRECGHGGPFEEFTVEVNPEDIVEKGAAYVEGLLRLGVNRVSMGVQSFDDGILRWMNRRHDSATAVKAYRILESAGVGNISVDLIFGLLQLSDDQWNKTLDKALGMSSKGCLPHHISSYQLSVEPGSALAGLVGKGEWEEASEELCARQYAILCDRLHDAGYHHYEISNFAQPGFEAKHNSAYWSHVPYVGLGPGAHSYSGAVRQWNKDNLGLYLQAGKICDLSIIQEQEKLDKEQLLLEHIMLGLRTSAGLPEEYLRANCSAGSVETALSCGHLVHQPDGSLRIPESHFFISDSIIASLV